MGVYYKSAIHNETGALSPKRELKVIACAFAIVACAIIELSPKRELKDKAVVRLADATMKAVSS